jgi:cobalt-zinc-cadmium efflux system membrane fusion protein
MKVCFAVGLLFFSGLFGCSGARSGQTDAGNAVAVTAQSGHIKFPENSPQLTRIQSVVVEVAKVPEVEIIAPGKIEANPTKVSKIVLPVTGRVGQVLVSLGDTVKQGQAVVTVDSPDGASAMSAYRQAEANVAQSKAGVAKADADLQRTRDLYANRAAAQKEVLAAETVLTQSQAALTQAQAAQEEALKRLEVLGFTTGSGINQLVTIRSSVSGKVIDITAVSGEYHTDMSTPVLTVADLSTVWVAADVPEDQVRFAKVGNPVHITINAYPGEVFEGRVMRIGDVVDPQTRTVKVRAQLANPNGRFRPEMFAQLREQQGSIELPVVPRTALIENQGKTVVYIERSRGDFEEVPVQVAWQGADRVAIRSGLRAGDHVVVAGGMLLRSY